MTERPRFFDDLAGVAGGAMSALAGLREEAESLVKARVDEAVRKLDLVRREDLEAVQEMAANARAGQQAAEARIAALEARVAELSGSGVVHVAPGASSAGVNSASPVPGGPDTTGMPPGA